MSNHQSFEAARGLERYAKWRRRSAPQGPKRLLANFIIGSHALAQADRFFDARSEAALRTTLSVLNALARALPRQSQTLRSASRPVLTAASWSRDFLADSPWHYE